MPHMSLTLTTHSPHETEILGQTLGRLLKGGEVVGLEGNLGTGKTCLVRGVARGIMAPTESVSSPTFTLHHPYPGRILLHHLDLYRIERPEEIEELGFLELLEDREAALIIEWADKAGALLPSERLTVRIHSEDEQRRRLEFTATGASYFYLLKEVERQFQKPGAVTK